MIRYRLFRVLVNPIASLAIVSDLIRTARSDENAQGLSREDGRTVDVTGQQEIERLDLVDVPFPFVEIRERSHNGRTADRHTSNSRRVFEVGILGLSTSMLLRTIFEPDLRNPFAVFALGIGRIQQMAQAVLRPAVFFIIHVNGFAPLTNDRSRLVLPTARRAARSEQHGTAVLSLRNSAYRLAEIATQ